MIIENLGVGIIKSTPYYSILFTAKFEACQWYCKAKMFYNRILCDSFVLNMQ